MQGVSKVYSILKIEKNMIIKKLLEVSVQLNICFIFININVSAVVNKYFCGKQNSFHRQKMYALNMLKI